MSTPVNDVDFNDIEDDQPITQPIVGAAAPAQHPNPAELQAAMGIFAAEAPAPQPGQPANAFDPADQILRFKRTCSGA